MTLVDTSAWVEFLRSTGSPIHLTLHELIAGEHALHTTEVVVMEVLAGGRDESHTNLLRRLLMRCEFVAVEGLGDYERAAAIHRRCRRSGETVRALTDCVIAAVAIRTNLDLLQADRDFDAIARHSPLELHAPPRAPR